MKKKLSETTFQSFIIKLSKVVLIAVLAIIYLQAQNWAWKKHMLVDGYFAFYDRASYFLEYHNLTNIPFNEYQPGAIFYFVSLSPALLLENTRDFYLLALLLSNVLLILIYAKAVRKSRGPWAVLGLSTLLLAVGPLILFRFEMYVHWWVILGLWAWQRKQPFLALLFIGIATSIKVYPVLLIPYFLLLIFKQPQHRLVNMTKVLAGFATGLTLVIVAYMTLFQTSFSDITKNVLVHEEKPVHIESISGTLVTAWHLVTTQSAPQTNSYLIHGLSEKSLGLPTIVYHYLWLLPVGLYYLWLLWKLPSQALLRLEHVIGLYMLFLLSVSQLGPQYFLWFALFVPFLPHLQKGPPEKLIWLYLQLSLLFFLTQLEYPLFYDAILDFFYRNGTWTPVLILFARNVVFAGVVLSFFRQFVLPATTAAA
nr:glycosyltransferase 87 family protein [bacterium]